MFEIILRGDIFRFTAEEALTAIPIQESMTLEELYRMTEDDAFLLELGSLVAQWRESRERYYMSYGKAVAWVHEQISTPKRIALM